MSKLKIDWQKVGRYFPQNYQSPFIKQALPISLNHYYLIEYSNIFGTNWQTLGLFKSSDKAYSLLYSLDQNPDDNLAGCLFRLSITKQQSAQIPAWFNWQKASQNYLTYNSAKTQLKEKLFEEKYREIVQDPLCNKFSIPNIKRVDSAKVTLKDLIAGLETMDLPRKDQIIKLIKNGFQPSQLNFYNQQGWNHSLFEIKQVLSQQLLHQQKVNHFQQNGQEKYDESIISLSMAIEMLNTN